MKNVLKPKLLILFSVTAALFLLSGCKLLTGSLKAQDMDFVIFDNSIPAGQTSELRFYSVNIKSFNEMPVYLGNEAINIGVFRVPAGTNTLVFDWVLSTANMGGTDFDSARGNPGQKNFALTTGLKNITFSEVEMLPGHKYQIGGALDKDGNFRSWIVDMTYAPSGFYGDRVAKPPRVSRIPTEFQGTWINIYGETFSFNGNRWEQTLPAMTGLNPTSSIIRYRGTFTVSDGVLTLFVTDMFFPNVFHIRGGSWFNIRAMRNVYIYRYSFSLDNLLLELPYILPETKYILQ